MDKQQAMIFYVKIEPETAVVSDFGCWWQSSINVSAGLSMNTGRRESLARTRRGLRCARMSESHHAREVFPRVDG